MKLSEFKNHLQNINDVNFVLPNGKSVPKHFHVTEIGEINKRFIDCGGTVRNETTVSVQLWSSVDIWHRLKADKLIKIIELSEENLSIIDAEIEVEYQGNTIEKYALDFKDGHFLLVAKQTDCLAKDKCGVEEKVSEIKEKVTSCCDGSGCC